MTHTNFSLGISSTVTSATPTAAKTSTPPTALKQLDNLVREVKDPQLRRVLQTVFGEPHVQGDILAAHFASHRDPVVVEPENHFTAPTAQHSAKSEPPQPRLRYVHFYEFETDPRQSSVACPNIAQIQLVARLARDTGGTSPRNQQNQALSLFKKPSHRGIFAFLDSVITTRSILGMNVQVMRCSSVNLRHCPHRSLA